MIRLALVSDSHGAAGFLEQAVPRLRDCQALCHMGDTARDGVRLAERLGIPCHAVAGNCDVFPTAPRELTLTVEGFRILLTHGDRYGVKRSLSRLSFRARAAEADIVLYGHTHIPSVDRDGPILFINPGALMNGRYALLEFRPNGPVPVIKIL